jgi:hypothetical protein
MKISISYFVKESLMKGALFLSILLLLSLSANAQRKRKQKEAAAAADTAKTKMAAMLAAKAASSVKPYKEVIPANAKTMTSFFKVHLVNERYLFELPDSMLKRDIMIVTRLNQGPADIKVPTMGYSGDEVGQNVIQFEKIPGDKLIMRSVTFKQFSNDTTKNGLSRSLLNSNYQTIEGAFPVKAINKEGKGTVIDLTDFMNADNSIFGMTIPFVRSLFGGLAMDRSFIDHVSAFPENMEIRTVKTYFGKPGMMGQTPPVSYKFNHSIVLLPKTLMKPRLADLRVGFFSNEYVDFDKNPRGVGETRYIWRWRLEPKEEDLEKYKQGILVEPRKPIVIYIDPATPKKWVPFLKAGIEDWQVAFEKAGFKNAIMAKDAPVNDSTWSIEDARHSVLVYKPSAIANAMGPSIKDPRTGEILETHIDWYHSVMTLLQNWYVIQAGAIDSRAQKADLDDELMGQLIRFVSSHEVGHTLGLMHNFGASSTVPVEKLRDKAWVEAHGHTPSIMDYARFNYVAQPEDNISEKGIFPRIGDYDKWAIEWGYKYMPEARTVADEIPLLNQMIVKKLSSGKQYFYGSQLYPLNAGYGKMNLIDPRSQSEDLGDDAMKASYYGIKNLKRIKPNLLKWYRKPNENYAKAESMYKEIVDQYQRYMGHVVRNIGGVYVTPRTTEDKKPVFEAVSKDKQQRAMVFLQQQLFSTPEWLIDKKLYSLTSTDFSFVQGVQKKVLSTLLSPTQITQMVSIEDINPKDAYTARGMLNDLKRGIFSELSQRKPVSRTRRDLQKIYVEAVIAMLSKPVLAADNDGLSIIKAHAKALAAELKNAGSNYASGSMSRIHLTDLNERLERVLKPNPPLS